jgi:Flp pilus assembly protein TadG
MFDRAKNPDSPAQAAPPRGRGGRLLLRRFRRSQDGVVVVEFAMVAVPFFALLLAIFETALMFWTNQVLEESLSQASRSLFTGQSQYRYTAGSPAANAAKFRDDICALAPMGLIDCTKLSVDVRTYASFADAGTGTAASNPVAGGALNTTGFTYNQPQRNDIVVVRAVLDYKLFLTSWASAALANIGPGRHGIVASMAFRAEPFSSSP